MNSVPPSGPKSMSAPSPSAPPPTGWSAVVLAGVELEIARLVGPVAKVLVRRAAKEHKDLDSLVQALLPAIDAAGDRETFSRAVLGRSSTGPQSSSFGSSQFVASRFGAASTSAPLTESPALTPQDLERATKLLIHYIGPIGKVVARRAAVDGVSRRDFFATVLNSIDGDDIRERFLREAGVV